MIFSRISTTFRQTFLALCTSGLWAGLLLSLPVKGIAQPLSADAESPFVSSIDDNSGDIDCALRSPNGWVNTTVLVSVYQSQLWGSGNFQLEVSVYHSQALTLGNSQTQPLLGNPVVLGNGSTSLTFPLNFSKGNPKVGLTVPLTFYFPNDPDFLVNFRVIKLTQPKGFPISGFISPSKPQLNEFRKMFICSLAASSSREGTPSRESGLSLYPNPAHKQLMLTYDAAIATPAIITIRTLQGQVIWQKRSSAPAMPDRQRLKIPVQHLPVGMYILDLQVGDRRMTQKFIRS